MNLLSYLGRLESSALTNMHFALFCLVILLTATTPSRALPGLQRGSSDNLVSEAPTSANGQAAHVKYYQPLPTAPSTTI